MPALSEIQNGPWEIKKAEAHFQGASVFYPLPAVESRIYHSWAVPATEKRPVRVKSQHQYETASLKRIRDIYTKLT
ncbi:MAG: hypothetical protein Q4C22_07430 [Bacillota bacterium]|nr:hypothetical protein [Bacillota bacterium]